MASIPVRPEPSPKKRKVRKGTSSCWECKHRKKRCDFRQGSNSGCVSCQQREIPCRSQAYAEIAEDDHNDYEVVGNRIDRVEDLVNQLLHKRATESQGHPGPAPFDVSQHSTLSSISHERMSRGPSLIGYLVSSLPAPHITAIILGSNKQYKAPLQNFQNSQHDRESRQGQSFQTSDISLPDHPVTLACRLIQLALCLQELNQERSAQLSLSLEEPTLNTARRYFRTATRLVTSQDNLVSSLDGLETLMLQGRYHISVGELSVASQLFNRALRIAHLIGLTRETASGGRANSIWFQLIYSDCFLALMLGRPVTVSDNFNPASGPTLNSSAQHLERIHVTIAHRIIARNMRARNRKNDIAHGIAQPSYEETRELDSKLKSAARTMPTAWWMPPTLSIDDSDHSAMQKTATLLVQTHQYYLLVMLHQPYVFQRPSDTQEKYGCSLSNYMYSAIAVVTASREVLTRYLVLRYFHRSSSYRGFDEKAFTASLALLFAHLGGHSLGIDNVLEHQRPQDLGILECAIECMERVASINRDRQSSARSEILRRLAKIESDAADGSNYIVYSIDGNEESLKDQTAGTASDLEVLMPYFGSLHITCQAVQPKDTSASIATHMSDSVPEISFPTPDKYPNRQSMSRDSASAFIVDELYDQSDLSWLEECLIQEDEMLHG